jgi:hypothetical protein
MGILFVCLFVFCWRLFVSTNFRLDFETVLKGGIIFVFHIALNNNFQKFIKSQWQLKGALSAKIVNFCYP